MNLHDLIYSRRKLQPTSISGMGNMQLPQIQTRGPAQRPTSMQQPGSVVGKMPLPNTNTNPVPGPGGPIGNGPQLAPGHGYTPPANPNMNVGNGWQQTGAAPHTRDAAQQQLYYQGNTLWRTGSPNETPIDRSKPEPGAQFTPGGLPNDRAADPFRPQRNMAPQSSAPALPSPVQGQDIGQPGEVPGAPPRQERTTQSPFGTTARGQEAGPTRDANGQRVDPVTGQPIPETTPVVKGSPLPEGETTGEGAPRGSTYQMGTPEFAAEQEQRRQQWGIDEGTYRAMGQRGWYIEANGTISDSAGNVHGQAADLAKPLNGAGEFKIPDPPQMDMAAFDAKKRSIEREYAKRKADAMRMALEAGGRIGAGADSMTGALGNISAQSGIAAQDQVANQRLQMERDNLMARMDWYKAQIASALKQQDVAAAQRLAEQQRDDQIQLMRIQKELENEITWKDVGGAGLGLLTDMMMAQALSNGSVR